MRRIFTFFAVLDSLLLLAAVVSGTVSKLRAGVLHPEEPTYLSHFILGLSAAVGCLLVHCLVMTYFLGTGRWVKEVCLAYGLPDEVHPRKTRILKLDTTPKALLAMGVTIATAAAGQGNQHQVWPWWIHLVLACLALVVNAWVFRVQHRNVTINAGIIEAVMNDVERIRAEHGLRSSAEELQREEV